jgi:hypothetical protein
LLGVSHERLEVLLQKINGHRQHSLPLRRSQDGADTARRLYAGAHEQRVAADVLLTQIEGHVSQEQVIEPRSRCNAVLLVDDYGDVRELVAEVAIHHVQQTAETPAGSPTSRLCN